MAPSLLLTGQLDHSDLHRASKLVTTQIVSSDALSLVIQAMLRTVTASSAATGQKPLNMSWNLGSGAITSHAVAGSTTAVCIRRALKRPWDFHAMYDLYIIHSDRTAPVEALRRDQIDISSLCWQIAPRANNDRTLLKYLPYTLSECRGAMRAGATDVQFAVRNIEVYPIIEISFLLASKGNTRFKRIDEPFNELGVESDGLRDLGIFLEEDLQSPLILEVDPRRLECFF
jgi:hypothetical protein